MARNPSRSVVFQPDARAGLQDGINQLANAIRPTLGPGGRAVAVERSIRNRAPSLLDAGGVIARRMIQLPDRDADTGAMLLRHLLWNIHSHAGDGSATAAVLFQAVYNGGARYLAAGGNAMLLRRQLEAGLQHILQALDQLTTPVAGPTQLRQIADSVGDDPALAALLGEIFDIIGAHGPLDLQDGRGMGLERTYVEGAYWPGPLHSVGLLDALAVAALRMEHAGVVVSDLDLEDPADLVPLLELALQNDLHALLIVANQVSEKTLSFLAANRAAIQVVVARPPTAVPEQQAAALQDLALLTGGRALLQVAGQRLRQITIGDLGRARRVWADRQRFGVASGAGDPQAIRTQLRQLGRAFDQTEDPALRAQLRDRIGRLRGGSATLVIGGATESAIAVRRALAERAATVIRSALHAGVVPGGGVALLACRAALQALPACPDDTEARAARAILLAALEAPFRVIAANAGHEPSTALANVDRAEGGAGLDARTGAIVDMRAAGIVDSAGVVKAAVRGAVSTAALALTIDVLVHPSAPVAATEP